MVMTKRRCVPVFIEQGNVGQMVMVFNLIVYMDINEDSVF